EAFVRRANNVHATVIHAAVFDVLIHDVGDRHAAVEIVHDKRTAGAAPERDSMTLDVRSVDAANDVAVEAVAKPPSQRVAGHQIRTLELKFERSFAPCCGQ